MPPGDPLWQIWTWNPLILWVIGIRLKETDSDASRCRNNNFYRKKHSCFKLTATVSYRSEIYKPVFFWNSALVVLPMSRNELLLLHVEIKFVRKWTFKTYQKLGSQWLSIMNNTWNVEIMYFIRAEPLLKLIISCHAERGL